MFKIQNKCSAKSSRAAFDTVDVADGRSGELIKIGMALGL
jgi:hypothetical protein